MPRTETTRRQYGPNNGRCPGDVTDEDRAVVFPPLPGPTHWGAPGKLRCATFAMGLAPSLPPGARGVSCQRPFRRSQRFGPVSTTGVTAGYRRRSTTLRSPRRLNGTPGIIGPGQALWTVKA